MKKDCEYARFSRWRLRWRSEPVARHRESSRWMSMGSFIPSRSEIVNGALAQARNQNAALVIIRLNTPGGLMDAMRSTIEKIVASPVPVVTFVAPSGGRAASAGFFLLEAGDVAAMAPGTATGAAHPVLIGGQMDPVMKQKVENDAAAYLRSISAKRGRNSAARRNRRPRKQILHRSRGPRPKAHRPRRRRRSPPARSPRRPHRHPLRWLFRHPPHRRRAYRRIPAHRASDYPLRHRRSEHRAHSPRHRRPRHLCRVLLPWPDRPRSHRRNSRPPRTLRDFRAAPQLARRGAHDPRLRPLRARSEVHFARHSRRRWRRRHGARRRHAGR